MPAIPHLGTRQGLSAAAADGLLAGHGVGPDAPAEQQVLAGLLSSAAAPPSVRELAGETAAVAAFVLASREPGDRTTVIKPRSRRTKFLVAGLAAACVTAFGGAAAANALPAHLQQMVHEAFGAPAPPHHGTGPSPRPTASGSRSPRDVDGPGRAVGHGHSVKHGKANGHQVEHKAKKTPPGQVKHHKPHPANHGNH